MSIRPHPSRPGWYVVDYYPEGRNGKRARDPFESYSAAVEFESSIKSPSANRTVHPKIETVVEEYLQWVLENQRPATYEKRCQCFKRLLPTMGKFRVRELSQQALDRYISGMSRHTAHDDITSLKAIAAWMKKRNLADVFPFDVEFKRPESKVKPAPSPEDVRILIDTCKNENIKVMLQLMAYTGLRWKEVRLLRWEDYRNGEIRIDSPKTTEAIIAIPGILQQWFDENNKSEGWLFVGYKGKPYYKIGHFFAKFKKETGIALTPHLLRHAGAIYLEEITNGNVQAVNQFLRHASLGTTATYLRKYSSNKLRNSANSICDYVVSNNNTKK